RHATGRHGANTDNAHLVSASLAATPTWSSGQARNLSTGGCPLRAVRHKLDVAMNSIDTYVLGRSEAETRRLILQHQIYGPITRRLFEAAGIGARMRGLDVGTPAGGVAPLVAGLGCPPRGGGGAGTKPPILGPAR